MRSPQVDPCCRNIAQVFDGNAQPPTLIRKAKKGVSLPASHRALARFPDDNGDIARMVCATFNIACNLRERLFDFCDEQISLGDTRHVICRLGGARVVKMPCVLVC